MTNKRLLVIAALVAVLVGYAVFSSGSATTIADQPPDASGNTTETSSVAVQDHGADQQAQESAEAARFSNLPAITLFELPLEALDTLDLIDGGGPYPFDRDDLTFQNREGILPDRDRGHYREYTVITPGENDRGARRIVAGDDGERYYTADHYSSFSEILFD